ncbi:MAG: hypothetical protein GY930_23005 [bacterium]|nr:hypothetical protein [bacterium]
MEFKIEHTWMGLQPGLQPDFLCRRELLTFAFDSAVLALDGASRPGTGSDGTWTDTLGKLGVRVAPLVGSDCGWVSDWPTALLEVAEGMPLRNLRMHVGDCSSRWEW